MFQEIALVRQSGPIQQMIWFQKMNYAAYRPSHVVKALPISMPRMLAQHLDIRNREIKYASHASQMVNVVSAMELQFMPSIRKPLDPTEVLALCEAEARETTNDLMMLAILYAWIGQKEKAVDCCERLQSTASPLLAPVPEWEEAMRQFGKELVVAITSGNERVLLAA
ncbi:hypothetical protein [Luteibacter sp. HA06]